jgi:hypothetical protein
LGQLIGLNGDVEGGPVTVRTLFELTPALGEKADMSTRPRDVPVIREMRTFQRCQTCRLSGQKRSFQTAYYPEPSYTVCSQLECHSSCNIPPKLGDRRLRFANDDVIAVGARGRQAPLSSGN